MVAGERLRLGCTEVPQSSRVRSSGSASVVAGERLWLDYMDVPQCSRGRSSGGASVVAGERVRLGCIYVQQCSSVRSSGCARVGSGERLSCLIASFSSAECVTIFDSFREICGRGQGYILCRLQMNIQLINLHFIARTVGPHALRINFVRVRILCFGAHGSLRVWARAAHLKSRPRPEWSLHRLSELLYMQASVFGAIPFAQRSTRARTRQGGLDPD